jgi:hypothetical protein
MGDFPLRIDQGNVAFAHSLREFGLKGILEMDITGPRATAEAGDYAG